MKLLTRGYLLDKYGARMTVEQIAEVLVLSPGHVHNLIALKQMPIPTYKEGGRRFASYEDVADYLDRMAETARAELKKPSAPPA